MSGASLNTETEDREGVRLIHLSGPLDSATHDAFRESMDALVAQPGFHIVLDCKNLTYANSSGISLLAHYQRVSGQNLAFFGVAALNRQVAKAIDLLGMGNLVKLYPTVEEAMQAATLL